jgi:hypothetical protein
LAYLIWGAIEVFKRKLEKEIESTRLRAGLDRYLLRQPEISLLTSD